MGKKVAVIGGGVIGLCAAYYLRRDGADVVLCERDAIGAGSSSENAGLVVPSHFVPLAAPGAILQGLRWMFNPESPFYIRPRFDAELLRWLARFWKASSESRMRGAMPLLRDSAQASLRLYGDLAKEGLDFGLTQRGLLMLFDSAEGERHAVAEARLAEEIGVAVHMIDRTGIERLDPGAQYRARGGAYYSGDAHLQPERFINALADRLRRLDVEIRIGAEVLAFETKGPRIIALRSSAGRIQADEFVLAAGTWSTGLATKLGSALPLQPGKGYSITVPSPPHTPSIPAILLEARVAITPFEHHIRCAGTMELAGLEPGVNVRRMEAILRAIPRYYAGLTLEGVERSHPWYGFRPCTPDGLPYIGRLRSHPNLIAATGHAMIGMTLGPITGRIVADIVAERPSEVDLSLFSPDRFR